MKRVTIGLFSVLSSVMVATGALADGYVAEPSGGPQSAAEAAAQANRLDESASEPRASLRETKAIQEVDPELLSAAVGHYARARSLLIAAIREFDQGYKLAKPDAILNSKEWRSDMISRAEDLERVLAPQARASRFSVQYNADPRLLGQAGASTEAK